jgi:3-hydroxyisobutyrate dehydrogenase-like beta-hydroxyacid dehydrogenase
MGRRTFLAGPKPESATAIKLANNAVLGCAMVAMAEGFSLVRSYDVAPQVFFDVMTEGLFSAPAYKVYGQKMVDESYDQVGSPIHVGLKDANLIAAAADLARVPMPSHNVYRGLCWRASKLAPAVSCERRSTPPVTSVRCPVLTRRP